MKKDFGISIFQVGQLITKLRVDLLWEENKSVCFSLCSLLNSEKEIWLNILKIQTKQNISFIRQLEMKQNEDVVLFRFDLYYIPFDGGH